MGLLAYIPVWRRMRKLGVPKGAVYERPPRPAAATIHLVAGRATKKQIPQPRDHKSGHAGRDDNLL
jgi:hypothetical protein